MATRRFEAVIGAETGMPTVELPFDVKKAFGAARARVKVTVNKVVLRTTVAVYGGKSYVGFRKEIRDAAKIAVGDRVKVAIEADTEERVVSVPDDLARALAGDRAARKTFDGLSFTHQNEYAKWVAEARKPETRARRAARTLEMLREGKRNP
jgi:hypothetical protein